MNKSVKAELRLSPHLHLPGEQVVEVWWDNQMVATITGHTGPGVRVLSKHRLRATEEPNGRATPVYVTTVEVRK